jgi:hypothetical protein
MDQRSWAELGLDPASGVLDQNLDSITKRSNQLSRRYPKNAAALHRIDSVGNNNAECPQFCRAVRNDDRIRRNDDRIRTECRLGLACGELCFCRLLGHVSDDLRAGATGVVPTLQMPAALRTDGALG